MAWKHLRCSEEILAKNEWSLNIKGLSEKRILTVLIKLSQLPKKLIKEDPFWVRQEKNIPRIHVKIKEANREA